MAQVAHAPHGSTATPPPPSSATAPPPLPARRLASHPAVSKPTPSLGLSEATLHLTADSHESRSAPSSPTTDLPQPLSPRPESQQFHRGASPVSRPRSVMVNSDLNYTQLQFESSNYPVPRTRKDTKYSEVLPQDVGHREQKDEAEGGRLQVRDLKKEGPNQEPSDFVGDPFTKRATDPFSEDPFSTESSTWNDPAAFYDRPPPPRPLPSGPQPWEEEEPSQLEEAEKDMALEDSTSDFTGGSAYMDTTQFLRREGLLPLEKSVEQYALAEEVLQIQQEGEEARSDRETMPMHSYSVQDDPIDDPGQYEFPSALSRFPVTREGSEEGHMSTKSQHTAASKSSVSRPDMPLPPVPGDGGRVDMPLPPLPTSTSTSNCTPLLPARPSGLRHSRSPSGSGTSLPVPPPATSTAARDAPLANNLPPLPPRNRAAINGNARTTSPTPPQNSSTLETPRSQGSMPRGQAREDAIMELVSLGYSRSDVVRALAVASNDFNLAKLILKEFGARP